ncbi:hypothetical protein OIDMADRAFT_176359 [Oidiodendron maius Zn]|uniref:Uncharacterized protein n=1 Tax=Oidiodendron maius (strain Zn) TaxID=913774 RepID=A0A0C3D4Q8_OIDMZ|nr:hypothetical protein OIDMADRAFT_176359 [Oidiodendron maius Zn]
MSNPPAPHPGERLASYFEKFFTTVVGVATLGASLSFAKIVQTPVQPWIDYGVTTVTIQNYLSIAFLLLIIDLALTSASASALSLYRPQAVNYFGTTDSHERRIVMWWATAVSVVLFGLLFTSFIFLGLVVAAYTGPIGWVAVGFASLFGLIFLGVIVWQSPIGSPSPEEVLRREHHKHHHHEESFHEFPSPEKGQDLTPPDFGGEDYFYGEEPTIQDRYRDGSPTRMPANTMPFVDPVVPPYTADLRRLRSLKTSEESRYQAKNERPREDWKEASEFRTYGHSPRY